MISHKHRTVFVHIPKCGGKSIERLFLDDCGLDWANRDALNLRRNRNTQVGPRRTAHLTYRDYTALHYANDEIMRDYYVFSVVRHPLARLESIYRYMGFSAAFPYDVFVTDVLPHLLERRSRYFWFCRPQADLLVDETGRLAVDEIFHLEDTGEIEDALSRRFGPGFASLPHVDAARAPTSYERLKLRFRHARQGGWHWSLAIDDRVAYSRPMLARIEAFYETDFSAFGYDPERKGPPVHAETQGRQAARTGRVNA